MFKSSSPTDRGLSPLQDEVALKLGRCVLNLQGIELGLKDLLTKSFLYSPATTLEEAHAARAERFARQTLGQLTKELASIFSERDWDAIVPGPAPPTGGPNLGVAFTLSLEEQDRLAFDTALQGLVSLRNGLVHTLNQTYDLGTEEGCRDAATHLDVASERIQMHFEEIRNIYALMHEGYKDLTALVNAPWFWALLHGIHPDGQVDWPASTIVRLLAHAEAALAHNGWTELEPAAAHIATIAPEHTPRRYGCSSWRHVLHEAGPIFAVRRERGHDGAPGRTWYRSVAVPAAAP